MFRFAIFMAEFLQLFDEIPFKMLRHELKKGGFRVTR